MSENDHSDNERAQPQAIVNAVNKRRRIDKKKAIPRVPISIKAVSVNQSEFEFNEKAGAFPGKKQLKPFDTSTYKVDATSLVVGKRRAGKSYYSRFLVYHIGTPYPLVYVFTLTKSNRWWEQCVADKYIFEGYQPHIIDALMKNNDQKAEAGIEDREILIILDDIIGEDDIKNDRVLKKIFTLGRHKGIALLVLIQYAFAVSTIARGNSDYVFSTLQLQNRQREALQKDYGDVMDKNEFYNMLDDNTQDRNMLVMDLSENTPSADNIFFVSKADNPGPFRLGAERCWADEKGQAQMARIMDDEQRLKLKWDTKEEQAARLGKGKRKIEEIEDEDEQSEDEQDEEQEQDEQPKKRIKVT